MTPVGFPAEIFIRELVTFWVYLGVMLPGAPFFCYPILQADFLREKPSKLLFGYDGMQTVVTVVEGADSAATDKKLTYQFNDSGKGKKRVTTPARTGIFLSQKGCA